MLSISQSPSNNFSLSSIPATHYSHHLRAVPSFPHSLATSLNTSNAHHNSPFNEFGRRLPHHHPVAIQTSNASNSVLEPPNQLRQYGYNGLFTEVRLELSTIAEIVPLVARQFKSRSLDSPLLFSTHALDISVDGVHSLIRSFIYQPQDFLRDLQVSSLHDLSSFLKWIIARHVDGRGKRGFLDWDTYAAWREAEKESNYHPNSIVSHLLTQLPSSESTLLTTMLDLFSSVSAYSHLNGTTIHKCGTIFGSFIFGLEDDLPFEMTYCDWLRFSNATEHMVLSYLRDQKATSATGHLPSRLESSIRGYPKVIPGLLTHSSARLENVARFRRKTRSFNPNLIQNGGEWGVLGSNTWDSLQVHPNFNSHTLTQSYEHLLNINPEVEIDRSQDPLAKFDHQTQRFRTLNEKDWSSFASKGFSGQASTPDFDLNESERAERRQRRKTMEWDSFTDGGFSGRETYTPTELQLEPKLSKTIAGPLTDSKALCSKKSNPEKPLPEFPYDSAPEELAAVLVDENFFEAWIDIRVCTGWSLNSSKDVSWVLVHYNSRTIKQSTIANSPESDGRVGDKWVIFEEIVPRAYRDMLEAEAKKQKKRGRKSAFGRVGGEKAGEVDVTLLDTHSGSQSSFSSWFCCMRR